jgi:non-structural maintenance of chromosomes element 1
VRLKISGDCEIEARHLCVMVAADGQLEIPDHPTDWEPFLEKINHSLDDLNFELKHMQDEHTGRLMYALVRAPALIHVVRVDANSLSPSDQVNVQGDEIAQLATEYTPVEIMFFKAIVCRIHQFPRLLALLSHQRTAISRSS